MNNILTEGTTKTPQIDFNQHTGELILSGKSIPENSARVYEPLLEWITDYLKSPCNITNLRLNLEYFNTSTSLWLAKMVSALSKINREDCILFIHMYFDIEDFDSMEVEDIKDTVIQLVDNIGEGKVSIGVKTHGTDTNGRILKESMIYI